MPNSTNMDISVRKSINAQKEKITRIVGDITQEGMDNLEEAIAVILVGVKSDHFEAGRTNGHLTVIITVEEYPTIVSENALTYNPPINIDVYSPTVSNATAALQAVKEAEWNRNLIALETFNGACSGAKVLIIYGV